MLGCSPQSVVFRFMGLLKGLVAPSVSGQCKLSFVAFDHVEIAFAQVLEADGVGKVVASCLQACWGH